MPISKCFPFFIYTIKLMFNYFTTYASLKHSNGKPKFFLAHIQIFFYLMIFIFFIIAGLQ